MSMMKKTALTLVAATIAAGALTGAASARMHEQRMHRAYAPNSYATETRAEAQDRETWILNRSMPAFDNSVGSYDQRNDGRLGTY